MRHKEANSFCSALRNSNSTPTLSLMSDPLEFNEAGLPTVLYLFTIRHWAWMLFFMGVLSTPVFYYQLNLFLADRQSFFTVDYVDIFSLGSLYYQMAAGPRNHLAVAAPCRGTDNNSSSSRLCYKIRDSLSRYVFLKEPSRVLASGLGGYNGYQLDPTDYDETSRSHNVDFLWVNVFVLCAVLVAWLLYTCFWRWERVHKYYLERYIELKYREGECDQYDKNAILQKTKQKEDKYKSFKDSFNTNNPTNLNKNTNMKGEPKMPRNREDLVKVNYVNRSAGVDAQEDLTPKHFSLEIHGLPKEMGDGQLFMLADNFVNDSQRRVFPSENDVFSHNHYDTANEKELASLNQNYSIEEQKKKFLANPKHKGLKLAFNFRKFDNSILKFLQLTEVVDQIRQRRTYLYQRNKFDRYSIQYDDEAARCASREGGDSLLQELYDSYDLQLTAIADARLDKVDFEEAEVMFGLATFESVQLKNEIINEYREAYTCYYVKYYLLCCCYKFPEKFVYYEVKHENNSSESENTTYNTISYEKHYITLKEPQFEPGEVLWEHLYVPPVEKCLRECLFALVCTLVLLLSMVPFLASLQLYKHYDTLNIQPWENNCRTASAVFELYTDKTVASEYDISGTGLAAVPLSEFTLWKRYNEANGISVKHNFYFCYCNENDHLGLDICHDETVQMLLVYLLPIAVALLQMALNQVTYYLLNWGVNYTRPFSALSRARRLVSMYSFFYVMQFAVLIILLGGNFSFSMNINIQNDSSNSLMKNNVVFATLESYFSSYHDSLPEDVNQLWYNLVGVQILTNVTVEYVLTVLLNLLYIAWRSLNLDLKSSPGLSCLCCGYFDWQTQAQMNEAYAGCLFDVYHKAASTYNVISVCLLLGPSMPALYPIGFLQLLTRYTLDKYYLSSNIYKKPDPYSVSNPSSVSVSVESSLWNSSAVFRHVHSALYAVGVVHILWALWVYSDPNFMNAYSTDYPADKYLFNQDYLWSSQKFGDLVERVLPYDMAYKWWTDADLQTSDGYLYYLYQGRLWRTVPFVGTLTLILLLEVLRKVCGAQIKWLLYMLSGCCCRTLRHCWVDTKNKHKNKVIDMDDSKYNNNDNSRYEESPTNNNKNKDNEHIEIVFKTECSEDANVNVGSGERSQKDFSACSSNNSGWAYPLTPPQLDLTGVSLHHCTYPLASYLIADHPTYAAIIPILRELGGYDDKIRLIEESKREKREQEIYEQELKKRAEQDRILQEEDTQRRLEAEQQKQQKQKTVSFKTNANANKTPTGKTKANNNISGTGSSGKTQTKGKKKKI